MPGHRHVKPVDLFSNPASNQIGASLWLLIYCIKHIGGTPGIDDIKTELRKLIKRVRSKDHQFYLMWSSGYDLDDVLHRLSEIGLLEETMDEDKDEPVWHVRQRGEGILKDRVELAPGDLVENLR